MLYLQDHKGTQLYLGINHCGILTFQGSRKTNHFRWSEVQKINYEGKMFIVHLTINEVTHSRAHNRALLVIFVTCRDVTQHNASHAMKIRLSLPKFFLRIQLNGKYSRRLV